MAELSNEFREYLASHGWEVARWQEKVYEDMTPLDLPQDAEPGIVQVQTQGEGYSILDGQDVLDALPDKQWPNILPASINEILVDHYFKTHGWAIPRGQLHGLVLEALRNDSRGLGNAIEWLEHPKRYELDMWEMGCEYLVDPWQDYSWLAPLRPKARWPKKAERKPLLELLRKVEGIAYVLRHQRNALIHAPKMEYRAALMRGNAALIRLAEDQSGFYNATPQDATPGWPRCSTCDGGGCPDCTEPA